ncbi:adenylyltransferase/cytidyltransferase family protein [Colwellia sp. BRX8-4]|uniref:adenylyltransferase/cytidyltransferase family protein n=1 Tax=Colwellia sp. BRX8-4 TaxID=2759836 RepID=UPI0015F5304B|nr:adenylyltransferase/cytidyltransferase family protein [Colwellia sp. BRX8-4]MBA6364328.1 adenylyltransferase/cytidyltransferase family protein [Colwellia sp. BRX8-8]MBA6370471.1 adenylyltransferase/cytidyltransferase family protein [Colwellia sp. BRX8-4]
MKKTVGYTTGVFDMFHIGHLHLLKKAKRHCDYLIVGVSSDELVQSYKDKTPIIPFEHRYEIVNGLDVVDEVVVQSHRDKIKQFHEIQYDLMFVGDDWKGSPLFNEVEAELNKHGAGVVYFEYTKEVSSTKFTGILQDIYDAENKLG